MLYVTVPSKEEAKKIARILVEQKLVSCVNFFPIESIYQWEGEIMEEQEQVLLIKTANDVVLVAEEIKKIHPYEIPCILEIKDTS